MWERWWSLPGPATFVEDIVRDLRSGRNVVVGLPAHGPLGLEAAVRTALEQDEFITWRAHQIDQEVEDDPLLFLGRRYATDLDVEDLRTVSSLVQSSHFVGHVIFISGLDHRRWPQWKSFLAEYAEVVRRRPDTDRGLICAFLEGEPLSIFPADDVALSVRLWSGRVAEFDLVGWLYLHSHRTRIGRPLNSRLRMRLGVELMGFDATLAPRVADLDLETLSNPKGWLDDVARERDWSNDIPREWHTGTLDLIDGTENIHPAILAFGERGRDLLADRVWRAQVGVLLPMIEEERTRLSREYVKILSVPFETPAGAIITSVEDLEIGHICHQLRGRISNPEHRHLVRLRNARNALAHHEPLSADELHAIMN